MRDLAFMAAMASLLPLAIMRPFAGVLLWSWISFMNPHRLVWGFAMELPWAMAVFAATLVGCVLAAEPKRLPMNGVTLLLVALLGCFTATSFAAMGEPTAVWAKWEATTKIIIGLLLTAALLTERRRVQALVWVMIISIGYYSVRGGIFSILTGGQYRIWGPEQTIITDNNHLAAAMLVTLPLMHYLRLHSKHPIVRNLLLAAMLLTLLSIVTSYSRGALLGLLGMGGMMWLRSKRKVVSAIVMTACLAGAIAFMPGQWGERMESIGSYKQDESASERLTLWGISLDLALQRPLVGSGFTGPYTRSVVDTVAPDGPARAVHSIWFELLGEHGFPTFMIWTGLSLTGLFYAIRLARMTRQRPDLAWAHDLGRMAQVSIMAYMVSGSFLSLSYWDFYWTLLVVIAAAYALAKRALAGETLPGTTSEAMAAAGWRNRAAIPAVARDALPRSARA
ncbi:putative O-glycosylation ligase, exosortase A system-associated [Pseudoroseomonas wenyumeiae]|uniref:O-glycosylation ligase, exosortase A system-associated n=1 Tax=Teichococcus wenyumeiae TaxID=2478470 RepID=A0A3A9J6C4_9PROT|nr:putative O-glycosylation ligase, exosortase A system-associated [Pseudoroseomonas wenyumeiae]RKK01470.1 putative O-glycosylation ligase, exosortase A system-associated [Pseudoroseomonas wenyumeiae]RMI17259.1 putative O-glycosylation ligase, exosortase A system-associated [Pseudoroseomonas wenyumeiae]